MATRVPLPLRPDLPQSLGAVSAVIQRVFSDQLTRYIERAKRYNRSRFPKIINDPVWRTVRLEPWETLVLDSPVLQRLRRIRQLGLAGYVFPGANYSRFEHSVGVLHQTQRLVDAINRNARARASQLRLPAADPIARSHEILLRLAALLHDSGHCFLSHVSERALEHLEPLAPNASAQQVKADATRYFGCRLNPPIGELLSALIVLLPEFTELLRTANIPDWEDVETLSYLIARAIMGGRDARSPYLAELISGALDADKLDYMPRDCYMAGLPMPVDVDRILEKIHVVHVPVSELPVPSLYEQRTAVSTGDVISVLAIQTSGARAFEEFVVSRFLLYSKLYYHQKVRCLEGMVLNALELLRTSDPSFRDIGTYLKLSDDDFLLAHWPSSQSTKLATAHAKELIDDVVNRRSFIRYFAFGPALISAPLNDADLQSGLEKLEPLVSGKRRPESIAFREAVTKRAVSYLETAGQANLAQSLRAHDVLIDLPDVQGLVEKTRFFVGDDSSGIGVYSERYQVGTWSEAYEDQKTVGYVYTWPEYAAATHFAFRDLVAETTGLTFGEASWSLTKLDPQALNSFARTLAQRSATSFRVFDLPSNISARLKYLDSTPNRHLILREYGRTLEDLTDRFKTFQSSTFAFITRNSIEEWLLQFEPRAIPLAITILQNIRFWNRTAIVDALAEGIERLFSGENRIQMLALGGATASGPHIAYYIDDVRKLVSNKQIIVASAAAQVTPNTPTILYEDNVGVGRQPGTLIQQWFGVPRSEWLVDEAHSEPLTSDQRDRFRSCPLGLLFITGSRSGLSNLEQTAKTVIECDHVSTFIVSPTDISCFKPAARVFSNQDDATAAQSAFRASGLLALTDNARTDPDRWPQTRVETSALGYGNSGLLTVFHYNTPVTTLTALWKGCSLPDVKWTPLFPRRKRTSYSPTT